MNPLPRFVLLAAALAAAFAVACSGKDEPGPTPGVSPTATATPTPAPARTPTATPTRRPSPTPPPSDDQVRAELETHVLSTIPREALSTSDSFDGIEGVTAMPIYGGAYGQFTSPWLVVTVGRPRFDPYYPHFVAVYQDQDGEWVELDRLTLDEAEFIAPEAIDHVDLEPSLDWVAIDAGVGVHGGYFVLLSWDGSRLRIEVQNLSDTPGAGFVGDDLDGDGAREVFLNASNYYVFCYACAVIEPYTVIYRWDGRRLERVDLQVVPLSSPATPDEQANNRAVTLANGARWKEAYDEVRDARLLASPDETVRWNALFIQQIAEQRLAAARELPYPFLQHIFAGDWEAAVAELRGTPPLQLFSADAPVIAGTVAEGWEDALYAEVLWATNSARFSGPELAALEFLHGWALQMQSPGDVEALTALQRAAALAPGDTFFADAAAHVAAEG